MKEHIEQPKSTLEERTNSIYAMYNQHNNFKNYVKNNKKELIKVLNEDGTINENIKYNTKEYKAYIKEYIKKNDKGHLKALNPDGTICNKNIYSMLENKLLKIERKPLTEIYDNDPNFDPLKQDCYEIKKIAGTDLGFVNPGAKSPARLEKKILRFVRDKEKENVAFAARSQESKEKSVYNEINDMARFTIILPNYESGQALISYLIYKLGGFAKISDKPTHEGYHYCFQLKGINAEIQFLTLADFIQKGVDDTLYHTYVNKSIDSRSEEGKRKTAQEELLKEYAQSVFQEGDFQSSAPEMDTFINDYESRGIKKKEQNKLKNFCMLCDRAQLVQDEIAGMLPELIKEYTKFQNIELGFEK